MQSYIHDHPDKVFLLREPKKNHFLKWMLIKLVDDEKSRGKENEKAKQRTNVDNTAAQHVDAPVHVEAAQEDAAHLAPED